LCYLELIFSLCSLPSLTRREFVAYMHSLVRDNDGYNLIEAFMGDEWKPAFWLHALPNAEADKKAAVAAISADENAAAVAAANAVNAAAAVSGVGYSYVDPFAQTCTSGPSNGDADPYAQDMIGPLDGQPYPYVQASRAGCATQENAVRADTLDMAMLDAGLI
jgi:hypothetical protein